VNRLTCEQTFARLDDYVDRELSAAELDEVEQHLHICGVCATEFRIEQGVLEDIRMKLRRIRMPAGLMARISASLQRS
jgi:predicted PP-loop superfamily ATPase